jgi:endonuclease/exonuclease/phosphatase (EEP) superfamily protein YafD
MEKQLGRTTRLLIESSAVLYAALIGGLMLAWAIPSWQSDWIDLANIFAFWLFVPLLLLLPAALVLRSLYIRGTALLVLALFLMSFGDALAPQPAVAGSASADLRVATFNVKYRTVAGTDLATWLARHNIDIAAFQEVSYPMAADMQNQFGADYPYQYIDTEHYDLNVAVISRYPLKFLERPAHFRGHKLRVSVESEELTLINVHLKAPDLERAYAESAGMLRYETGPRQRGAEELFDMIAEEPGPLLVMGDFNTSDREALYRRFAAELTDSYRETAWGLGYTFPDTRNWPGLPLALPLVRIDYVWTGGNVTPLATQVSCEGLSDHCAVIADLSLPDSVGMSKP